MQTPTISIIVPVYKVEAYLQTCIDSILAQTFRDFELILVDDGSPDGCPAICDAAAEKDERIVVIHQKNGGLSAARNAGLDIARGEYIGFVDSDDFIAPEMYEKMYAAIQEYHVDLAICNLIRVDENEHPLEAKTDKTEPQVFSRREAIGNITKTHYHIANNKLYHRDIFASLRYEVGRLNEDTFAVPKVLGNVKKGVVFLPQQLYCYRMRSDSITGQKKKLKNYDAVEAAYGCWEFLFQNGYRKELINGVIFILGSLRLVYCGLSPEDRRSEKSRQMKQLLTKAEWQTFRAGVFSMRLFLQCGFFLACPMIYNSLGKDRR